jgi:hypothetical protein
MVGELAVADVMADRLAGSVAAGFMSVEMVPGWEDVAKSFYFEKPQTQRDEAIRLRTSRLSMPTACWNSRRKMDLLPNAPGRIQYCDLDVWHFTQ